MYVVLFLLLLAVISTKAVITEHPIDYEFCQCPCSKAEPLQVEIYFPTKAACTYLRNHFAKGFMFTDDTSENGRRQVYHDITHCKPPFQKRYPHSAFWKVYYPWKNYTGNPEDAPQVIQNILTLEFVVRTNIPVPQSNHEVVTITKLTSDGLWLWYIGDRLGYRIGSYIWHEFINGDALLTASWNEGRVFTDVMKRNSSSLHLDKFGWYLAGCYE